MLKKTLTGIFALAVAGYATASTTTYTEQVWDLRGTNSNANITGRLMNSNYTNLNTAGVRENDNSQINMTVGGVTAKVTTWSSTGEGTCGTGVECGTSAARDDDPFIQRAIMTQYDSGIGAINRDENSSSPDHGLDNQNGDTNSLDFDMVLFEFDSKVELTHVQSGWTNTDSDLSIVGYTGSGTLDANNPFGNSDTKWSDLLNQGWSSVTDTFDQGTSVQAIAPGYESKYWLVGVYNPVFKGTTYTHHNDAVKLAGIATRQSQPDASVPEPATFALLLAGVAAIFRRKLSA